MRVENRGRSLRSRRPKSGKRVGAAGFPTLEGAYIGMKEIPVCCNKVVAQAEAFALLQGAGFCFLYF